MVENWISQEEWEEKAINKFMLTTSGFAGIYAGQCNEQKFCCLVMCYIIYHVMWWQWISATLWCTWRSIKNRQLYLSHLGCAEHVYAETVTAIHLAHPEHADSYFSLEQVKLCVTKLTDICPIIKHMCINLHVVFVDLWATAEHCPICHHSCIHPTKGTPYWKFYTLPLIPQIQALKWHPESAEQLKYFWQRSQELLGELECASTDNYLLPVYDDICCGSDVLAAVKRGNIKEGDTVLIKSYDGA